MQPLSCLVSVGLAVRFLEASNAIEKHSRTDNPSFLCVRRRAAKTTLFRCKNSARVGNASTVIPRTVAMELRSPYTARHKLHWSQGVRHIRTVSLCDAVPQKGSKQYSIRSRQKAGLRAFWKYLCTIPFKLLLRSSIEARIATADQPR